VRPTKQVYGVWDTMYYSHKGRWGKHDFYYNFWRSVKKQIWQLYDLPIKMGLHLGNISGNGSIDTPLATSKPKLAFMARAGKNSWRYDGNVGDLERHMQQYFDVTVFTGAFYRWHPHNDSLRYELTRSTLLKVQDMDIMLGQGGSNMQLALFLQENKMNVEMKNYCPCCNEIGKNLANHNRLSFHTSFVRDVGTLSDKFTPVHYTPGGLSKLSRDILAAWHANVAAAQHESRLDSWPSTCDFLWPHQDADIVAKSSVLTRSNVSRCYLERVPTREGWYQLGKHKNSHISECYSDDVPPGTGVMLCMMSGLC
jgi:hypothetical protein